MDEGNDDTLGLYPDSPGGAILGQWSLGSSERAIYNQAGLYMNLDLTDGWFRHNNTCCTLFVPGNVVRIKKMAFTQGIDYRCYTGEKPAIPPPGLR